VIGGHALKRLIHAQRRNWQGDVQAALSAPVFLMPARSSDKDGRALPFMPEQDIARAINEGSLRMPYQVIIIESPGTTGTVVDLVQHPDAITNGNAFGVLAWAWEHGRLTRTDIHDVFFELNGDRIEIVDHPNMRAKGGDRCDELATTIIDCVLLITHSTHRAERAATIDRERLRKLGAGPAGWEYRVVDLPSAVRDRVDMGGTHASPRWHQRRGHWRRVAERRVWVKPCEVGDPARGGIVKDYAVAQP